MALAALAVATPAVGEETPSEAVPFAIAGPDGFGISSADGASRLVTHWLLQSDLRVFFGPDQPTPDRDSFTLRFGGVRLDAILERSFRAVLFANFAQNQVSLLEGWIEARLARGAYLRAGKFLYPISAERLTPVINLPFVSTSVSAILLPARDTGIQLLGTLGGDLLDWNLALTNGAVASGTGDAVADSGKDVVARLFVRPFTATGIGPLRQLGLGVGASSGRRNGTPDNSRLPTLQTYGGQTFFSYAKGVVARGRAQRLVPHLTWGFGPVALYGDAVWARDAVNDVDVASRAWSATAMFVVTGEAAAPLAFVIPRRPLDLAAGQLGAVALAAAVGRVTIGPGAFPALANPDTAMKDFTAYGLGLNWYPSRGVAVLVSYGHQVFAAASAARARPNEDTLIARFQLVL